MPRPARFSVPSLRLALKQRYVATRNVVILAYERNRI
jgi:hypothetical protein